jgi:hypothetical protein
MQDFILESTKNSPRIHLDYAKGVISLVGSSTMEDSIKFYEPILAWVAEYIQNPKNTTVNFDLEYFNTSSSKILLMIFKRLTDIKNAGFNLTVNWIYDEDDEDVKDTGQHFSKLTTIPFTFIPK